MENLKIQITMKINEFIKQSDKNSIISTMLKHYDVGTVRVMHKNIKNHAHYDVDRGQLQLSTKYKTLKANQIKPFLITILHEIRHAMDAKKYGWRKFKDMYEYEMNLMVSKDKDPYKDNKYEINAEKFGQDNWKKWFNKFKKEGLF